MKHSVRGVVFALAALALPLMAKNQTGRCRLWSGSVDSG